MLTLAVVVGASKPAASVICAKFLGLDALTSTEGLDWRAFVLGGLDVDRRIGCVALIPLSPLCIGCTFSAAGARLPQGLALGVSQWSKEV